MSITWWLVPWLLYKVKTKTKKTKCFRLGHNGWSVWFVKCGMVPGSTRTELLAPLIQAILRANHTRGIWDLSWLSTLGGVNWGRCWWNHFCREGAPRFARLGWCDYGVTGMVPGSTRTEHLVSLTSQAILRANHARGIWNLSWLSTLEGVSCGLVGGCF